MQPDETSCGFYLLKAAIHFMSEACDMDAAQKVVDGLVNRTSGVWFDHRGVLKEKKKLFEAATRLHKEGKIHGRPPTIKPYGDPLLTLVDLEAMIAREKGIVDKAIQEITNID